ncbi:MAG TPA: porphobilinogen synthase [Dietzia timorensis]|uniref:Delta-aminolevulinic acid dehydratase n=1 Tax=Dietzia timorensis TaxID=499555 RepID=A0A921F3M5_9ACTN|nr:porphobilinogen synthase [Dietzia timorensis]HJE90660.1 porphobilinogen synthase [Dietzia timorensis]
MGIQQPFHRPRRLRQSPAMRRLVSETSLEPRHLILPVFVADGLTEPKEISSLPGVYQHTVESIKQVSRDVVAKGLGGIMVFGVPKDEDKDATGEAGVSPDGILNQALRAIREEVGDDTLVMSDLCLDEFTDHGHCGVLGTDARGAQVVDNDATLEQYAKMAVAQAEAGAHIVAPSGMMDGQVAVIREALDAAGYQETVVLAYAAKYASAFYGPFREAVGSSLKGDRRTYQQDPGNARESLREVELDIDEGADIVMVKPAMSFSDIIAQTAASVDVPVATYQVSGEYAMLVAAFERGWLDREPAIVESLYSLRRAGADMILTYFALEAAQLINDGGPHGAPVGWQNRT